MTWDIEFEALSSGRKERKLKVGGWEMRREGGTCLELKTLVKCTILE